MRVEVWNALVLVLESAMSFKYLLYIGLEFGITKLIENGRYMGLSWLCSELVLGAQFPHC
jgi:hypothetical protein